MKVLSPTLFCFFLPLSLGLCLLPALAQDLPEGEGAAAEEENSEQLLSLEQRDSLVEKLEAIEQGFVTAREARHAAAFEALEQVIENDLALYNFFKECVQRTNYNDEDRIDASQDFDKWSRKFDEQTDREPYTNMLRVQAGWLFLLKRAEVLIRSSGDEGMQPELELTQELLAYCKQVFANADDYGEYFLDLRQSATSSAFSQAFGLDDLETGLVPTSPLDYQSILSGMVISPAKEMKNVPVIINGWNELIRMEREFIRIRFEINKKKIKRSDGGNGQNRGGNERGRDGENNSGNFERSEALENFQLNRLPQLMWRREMDRFAAGDQVDATKNLYNLLLNNPEHPNFRNWNSSLRSKIEALEFEEDEEEVVP